MRNHRLECTECGIAVRVSPEVLPEGHRPDELFERHCPGCERSTYMKLVTTS